MGRGDDRIPHCRNGASLLHYPGRQRHTSRITHWRSIGLDDISVEVSGRTEAQLLDCPTRAFRWGGYCSYSWSVPNYSIISGAVGYAIGLRWYHGSLVPIALLLPEEDMAIERIIIIIGNGVSGAGSTGLGFLILLFILFWAFSESGDRVEGTINQVQRRVPCYRVWEDIEKTLKNEQQSTGFNVVLHPTFDELNKITQSGDAVWLEKGAEVRILETPWAYNMYSWKIVHPLDNSMQTCFVDKGVLHMGFFTWIAWKYNSI